MAKYVTSNDLAGTKQALTSSYKTQVALTAPGTTGRALVYDLLLGVPGTPADNYVEWDVSRQTAAGTSTSVTPVPTDTTMRAAGTVGTANFTAEGTITATSSVFYIPVNQRASYRWVCAPGSELVIPAVNLSGLALRARSAAYTGAVGGTMYHEE